MSSRAEACNRSQEGEGNGGRKGMKEGGGREGVKKKIQEEACRGVTVVGWGEKH